MQPFFSLSLTKLSAYTLLLSEDNCSSSDLTGSLPLSIVALYDNACYTLDKERAYALPIDHYFSRHQLYPLLRLHSAPVRMIVLYAFEVIRPSGFAQTEAEV